MRACRLYWSNLFWVQAFVRVRVRLRHPTCKLLWQSVQGFMLPKYVTLMYCEVTIVLLFFRFVFGVFQLATAKILERIFTQNTSKTSFRWRMCILGSRWQSLIFRPQFADIRHFGALFLTGQFICDQKPLTYELPLIVIVALRNLYSEFYWIVSKNCYMWLCIGHLILRILSDCYRTANGSVFKFSNS